MTINSQQNEPQNIEKRSSRKWRKAIRNIGRSRKLEGGWKVFADSEPIILFLVIITAIMKLFSLSAFIMGLFGLLAIVKKEIRIKRTIIYGINAVYIGLLLITIFWLMAIWYFFS